MVTVLQINKAVNEAIKKALKKSKYDPEELIIAEDVSEMIIRPSIKVEIKDAANAKFNFACREKNLTVKIYFFAPNRYEYKFDNMKMQGILEDAFLDGLEVSEEFYIPVESVDSEVTDTVLICQFDLYMIELLPDTDPAEPMEEIIYKEDL